jgi:uncharacterized protein YbjT (DUF2867 family)
MLETSKLRASMGSASHLWLVGDKPFVLRSGSGMSQMRVGIAGGTGELGRLVAHELSSLGADVVILARGQHSSTPGVSESHETRLLNYHSKDDLVRSLEGLDVLVSTLSGLHPVIVEIQGRLIKAAALAKVKKFVPSDFGIDFRLVPYGDNRNLNLRRDFYDRFESVPIKKTSILSGAFTDMLTGTAPFIFFGLRRVLCWGDPHQKMDWTTRADTARYTAHAALDPDSPRFLRIAGDQISAADIADVMSTITGRRHRVLKPSGLNGLRKLAQVTRFFLPGVEEVYPPWQGMQYMHNMFSGVAKFDQVDNDLYPIEFRTVSEVLRHHIESIEMNRVGINRLGRA